MPYALVRGTNLYYEVAGEEGPWVTLTPGAWVSSQLLKPLASSLATAGYRVLLHDGRNTGMSDQSVAEEENITKVWAEDRYELLRQLDIAPVYAGGYSAGAMTSLLLALHHPELVSGLLLWLVARPDYAVVDDSIWLNIVRSVADAARSSGMEAVCNLPLYRERIALRPELRDLLMAMDPKELDEFCLRQISIASQDATLPVAHMTEEEVKSIGVPVCVVPGYDPLHTFAAAYSLAGLLPNAEFHDLWTSDERAAIPSRDPVEVRSEARARYTPVFIDFLRRTRSK